MASTCWLASWWQWLGPDVLAPRQVIYSLASLGIEEAVCVNTTAACESVSQDAEALETEARVAIPAHHLVTFTVLRLLPLQIFFGDCHFALRTLH
jgi:hypothetical protein